MALTFKELVGMDLVIKQTEKASQWVAAAVWDDMGPYLSCRADAGFYDSPLEAIFDTWWFAMTVAGRVLGDVEITPQHAVAARGSKYRIDFLLAPGYDEKVWFDARGYRWPLVAVELDGHDFHERTREQVAYRNQRDRDLQADGWVVLHFSGSELVRDPEECVSECYRQARELFGSRRQQVMAAERAADNQAGAPTSQES